MSGSELGEAGTTAPCVDEQIAAIALVHERVLFTGNVKNFAPFTGLRVENWV